MLNSCKKRVEVVSYHTISTLSWFFFGGKFTIAIAFTYINILKYVQFRIDSNFPLAEWKILATVYKLSNLTRPKILYSASSQYGETIYTNFHIT